MTPTDQTANAAVAYPRPRQEPSPAAVPAARGSRASRRARPLVAVLAVVLVAAAVGVWRGFFASSAPTNVIALSGRIEADDSAVATKTAGRVLEVLAREGDTMQAGDVIARLDDEQVRAREDQARAQLAQAEARARSAREQVAVLEEQLRRNDLQTRQARADAAGRVRQAEADLDAAEALLAQQEASYQLALFDKEAYARLAQSGAVSERQGRQATSTADQQAAAVAAAQRRFDALQGALATARANLFFPDIRASEGAQVRSQLTQQASDVATALAQIEQARAQLAEAQANRQDLIVRAPFAGTVMTRAAEPGEVIGNGTPIVTMADLSRVYLRGFVPEGQIGSVKVGQAARVYLDSNPNQPIDARVSRIDPQATFTPENTYFRDDRVKQVVGVKLQLNGAVGFAKPGMPADGEVLISGDTWPNEKNARR